MSLFQITKVGHLHGMWEVMCGETHLYGDERRRNTSCWTVPRSCGGSSWRRVLADFPIPNELQAPRPRHNTPLQLEYTDGLQSELAESAAVPGCVNNTLLLRLGLVFSAELLFSYWSLWPNWMDRPGCPTGLECTPQTAVYELLTALQASATFTDTNRPVVCEENAQWLLRLQTPT